MNECFLLTDTKHQVHTSQLQPNNKYPFPIFNFSDTAKSIAASLLFRLVSQTNT